MEKTIQISIGRDATPRELKSLLKQLQEWSGDMLPEEDENEQWIPGCQSSIPKTQLAPLMKGKANALDQIDITIAPEGQQQLNEALSRLNDILNKNGFTQATVRDGIPYAKDQLQALHLEEPPETRRPAFRNTKMAPLCTFLTATALLGHAILTGQGILSYGNATVLLVLIVGVALVIGNVDWSRRNKGNHRASSGAN